MSMVPAREMFFFRAFVVPRAKIGLFTLEPIEEARNSLKGAKRGRDAKNRHAGKFQLEHIYKKLEC